MGIFFLQGLVLGGTAAAQPGPFLAFLLTETLQHGWRRTLPAVFAPLVSDGPIVLLVLLVLTQTPLWLLSGLQVAGGVFLVYLGWRGLRMRETAVSTATTAPQTGSIWRAALLNFLSPNPYIFWGTIAGPILIEGWRTAPAWGLSFVAGFYGTLIGGFAAFVGVFTAVGKLDTRLSKALATGSAVIMMLFGLYQIARILL